MGARWRCPQNVIPQASRVAQRDSQASRWMPLLAADGDGDGGSRQSWVLLVAASRCNFFYIFEGIYS